MENKNVPNRVSEQTDQGIGASSIPIISYTEIAKLIIEKHGPDANVIGIMKQELEELLQYLAMRERGVYARTLDPKTKDMIMSDGEVISLDQLEKLVKIRFGSNTEVGDRILDLIGQIKLTKRNKDQNVDSFTSKLLDLVQGEFGESPDPTKIVQRVVAAMGWDTRCDDQRVDVLLITQKEVDKKIDRKFRNAEMVSAMIKNLNEAQEIMTGKVSDGYHTFDELYHHRAVLFMCLCRQHGEHAWMSLKHHSGDMYDHMFIVGINTPDGPCTYHYNVNPYWRLFKQIGVKEIEAAPKWDGHTPEDALDRISRMYGIKDITGLNWESGEPVSYNDLHKHMDVELEQESE